jgi:hypothetical protein
VGPRACEGRGRATKGARAGEEGDRGKGASERARVRAGVAGRRGGGGADQPLARRLASSLCPRPLPARHKDPGPPGEGCVTELPAGRGSKRGAATPPRAHPQRPRLRPPPAAGAASGGAIVPAAGGARGADTPRTRRRAERALAAFPRQDVLASLRERVEALPLKGWGRRADGLSSVCFPGEETEPQIGKGDLSKVTDQELSRIRMGNQVLTPAVLQC